MHYFLRPHLAFFGPFGFLSVDWLHVFPVKTDQKRSVNFLDMLMCYYRQVKVSLRRLLVESLLFSQSSKKPGTGLPTTYLLKSIRTLTYLKSPFECWVVYLVLIIFPKTKCFSPRQLVYFYCLTLILLNVVFNWMELLSQTYSFFIQFTIMQLPLEFESYSFIRHEKSRSKNYLCSLSATWVDKYLTTSTIYRNTTLLFKLTEIHTRK